jgi:hypothetical protein
MRHRALFVAVLVLVAAGCGQGDAPTPAEERERRARELERGYDFFSRHPYALTCRRVLAIDSAKAQQFHIAALSLAREVRLPGTNRNQLWQRFVYALLDLCQKADDPSYRPAAAAVRRVRRGEYVLRGGPPQHREDRAESGSPP